MDEEPAVLDDEKVESDSALNPEKDKQDSEESHEAEDKLADAFDEATADPVVPGSEEDSDYDAEEDGDEKEEAEDQDDPIDEELSGHPKWREAYGKKIDRIKELEAELKEKTGDPGKPKLDIDLSKPLGISTDDPAAEPAPTQPPEPTATVEFAIETLVRINSGDGDSTLKPAALQRLQQATPMEIDKIVEKAENNGYGEQSPEMETIALKALVRSNARHEEHKKVDSERNSLLSVREESVNKIKKIEGMEDAGSDVSKKFMADANELETILPGYFNMFPRAPEIVKWYQDMKNGGTKTEMDELRAEIAELKDTIGKSRSPQSSSQPATNVSVKKTPEENLQSAFDASGDYG